MPELRKLMRFCVRTAIGVVLSTAVFQAQAQERELKVGYMKNPIQDASLDIMEKWAKDHGVKLTRVPMAYSVFMEKVTATLTTGTDQFDVIWHNDDWGQLWKKWLDTTDDVKGIENADRWPLLAFWNDEKKLTVVPMATHGRDVLLPQRPRQTGRSTHDLRPAGVGEPAAAKRRQSEMGLCRRHEHEQHLVQLVVEHVGEQLRHPQAAVRARQRKANGRQVRARGDRPLP